jgi:hypothetical protein
VSFLGRVFGKGLKVIPEERVRLEQASKGLIEAEQYRTRTQPERDQVERLLQ